jgi:tRNA A-37 threonylcarbamoyl transferase component Bud32
MPWPTPQDYNEAVQNPWLNLRDRALMSGKVELDALGLPRPMTGAFATVYRINCEDRPFAIKLFIRQIIDQQQRYAQLSVSMSSKDLPYIVGFEYQPQGILVYGTWYPILKMEWAQGENLDQYIANNVNNAAALAELSDRFKLMMKNLAAAGVAHGDLQHGNVLVKKGHFKLVDYDGMYVSQLAKFRSNELGHPNYQHPDRGPQHFGTYLDNFSAWVIHTSLFSLSLDPRLWRDLSGGEECLLFRQEDFKQPNQSRAFSLLEAHGCEPIRNSASLLRTLLRFAPEQVPPLSPDLTDASQLKPIATAAIAVRTEPAPTAAKPKKSSRSSRESKAAKGEATKSAATPQEKEKSKRRSRPKPEIETQATASSGLPSWLVQRTSYVHHEKPRFNPTGNWPRYEEYRRAVNVPGDCFIDPELRDAVLIKESKGWGKNGAVFHFRCKRRHVAVKCFFKNQFGRQERFARIQKYAKGEAGRYFLDFEYLEQGIYVDGYWYPILKMEWVTPTLDEYIADNLKYNRARLAALPDRFRTMVITLQNAGIAHGDLEPENMVVVSGELKLIDYDGVYVPSMKGLPGIETGNPGFQHPDRSEADFGPHIDNFSAWILDAELTYLQIDPQLWTLAETRCQIFSGRRSDWAFEFLDVHPSKQVRNTGDVLRKLLDYHFNEIPYFSRRAPLYALRPGGNRDGSWRQM